MASAGGIRVQAASVGEIGGQTGSIEAIKASGSICRRDQGCRWVCGSDWADQGAGGIHGSNWEC